MSKGTVRIGWWRRRGQVRVFLALALLGAGVSGMGRNGGAPEVAGLQPKEETGASRFLESHPSYDGRGVVVAIFDTGVDPGAPGLQSTPDGRPKILDVVDATGDGDVSMGEDQEAADGVLTGLSGRRLRVSPDWRNPTGRYRLGLKRGEDFLPDGLLGRIRSKRKERWEREQRVLERELEVAVARAEMEEETGATTGSSDAGGRRVSREECEVRLAEFRKLRDGYEALSPVYDCVVFHDGAVWRAVVDTDEDGDLVEEEALTDFHRERRYGTLGEDSLMHFAVNVYGDGRVLSLVVDSGMHGTHVAGIVAAHFPGQPDLSGVAPGAQVVSVKIGDGRLGGMETSTGFERGLAVVRRWRCEVINLSYGEPTTLPNRGRLIRQLSEVVNEDGVVFVSAVGNSGPALSTVGAPGGTTSALIGVGAAVSPSMMRSAYSKREGGTETQFTFSGRGPAEDGDLGVQVSAPGAAISPVPNWTLQRGQLANGTSMASPNAAGGVALMLSGLKAEGVSWTPEVIRRALENSAQEVDGLTVFDQGRGMMQVDRAFEMAKVLGQSGRSHWRWEVSVPGRGGARGVYLREPEEAREPLVAQVMVRPVLRQAVSASDQLEVERRFRLVSTAGWVETPGFLLSYHEARVFEIRVDPTGLPPGVHYAEVQGSEEPGEGAGPAFRIPVTVVRTEPVSMDREGARWQAAIDLEPGRLARRFLAVPRGATRATVRVRGDGFEGERRLVFHAMQLIPGRPHTATGRQRHLTLSGGGTSEWALTVEGGRTLELCMGLDWAAGEPGRMEVEARFDGVIPGTEEVTVTGGTMGRRLEWEGGVGRVTLAPRASLTHRRRAVMPASHRIRPLDPERDGGRDGVVFREMVLTYRFRMDAARTVVPRFPALNGRIYDGEFGSQLYLILDGAGRRVTVDDGWNPGAVALESGGYELRLHLRHDRAESLESVRQMPLILEERLGSPVELKIYPGPDSALTGTGGWSGRTLTAGQRVSAWLAAPPRWSEGRSVASGEVWTGTIRYLAGDGATEYPLTYVPGQSASERDVRKGGEGTEDAAAIEDEGERDEADEDEDEGASLAGSEGHSGEDAGSDAKGAHEAGVGEDAEDEAKQALHGDQAKGLSAEPTAEEQARWDQAVKGRDWEASDRVLSELLARYPGHRSWWKERVAFLQRHRATLGVRRVVEGLDAVVTGLDQARMAAALGMREVDAADPDLERARREAESDRELLVEAMTWKIRTVAGDAFPWGQPVAEAGARGMRGGGTRRALEAKGETAVAGEDSSAVHRSGGADSGQERSDARVDAELARSWVDAAYALLERWVDLEEAEHVELQLYRKARDGEWGEVLRMVQEQVEDAEDDAVWHGRKVQVLEALGWRAWAERERAWRWYRELPADTGF